MAKVKSTATAVPTKTAKASKKAPAHETHGALEPRPTFDIKKAFGIKSAYDQDTVEQYTEALGKMLPSQLQSHAYSVGIVPMDNKDKLITALKRKFEQTKLGEKGFRSGTVRVSAEGQEFLKNLWAGRV